METLHFHHFGSWQHIAVAIAVAVADIVVVAADIVAVVAAELVIVAAAFDSDFDSDSLPDFDVDSSFAVHKSDSPDTHYRLHPETLPFAVLEHHVLRQSVRHCT